MTLFRNETHKEIWRQHWCEKCWQPDEAARRIQGKQTMCPIWERAMRTGRKPQQWDRMPRADEMVRTIRCNAYQPLPPNTRRPKAAAEDVSMFDVEPQPKKLVPVDGWPDKPKKDEVDHA